MAAPTTHEQLAHQDSYSTGEIRRRQEVCASRVSSVLQLFDGKWTVEILCTMRERPVRLSVLKREIPLASKKALTARLRALEVAGIIVRNDLSNTLLHVEYEIADSMREPLATLLDRLAEWAALVQL